MSEQEQRHPTNRHDEPEASGFDGGPGGGSDGASGRAVLAAEELIARLYDELHELARSRMRGISPGQTLQPTALIHETYLKLTRRGDPGWKSEGHFFGAAAIAMREIIVDQARRRHALKRGGDRKGRSLRDDLLPFEHDPEEVLALHEVLSEFERVHPRQAQIVTMHSFAGLAQSEIARSLGVSVGTVERDWRFAKAWLRRKMSPDSGLLAEEMG